MTLFRNFQKTVINFDDFLNIGLILTGFIGYIFSISSLLFFVDVSITTVTVWSIIVSYIVLCYAYFYYKKNNTRILSQLLWASFFVLVSLLVSSYFIDYSYDGQAYHGEAIIQLSNGWNPTKTYLPNNETNIVNLVINHFAKASWVVGAFFYTLTGNFESAKAANLIFIIANFFIAYPFFKKWFNKNLSLIFAGLIAFNPICLNMYLSNMLDSQIANGTFIFFILLFFYFEQKQKLVMPVIVLLIIYMLNLKFTVVGYFGIYIVALTIFFIIKKQLKVNLAPLIKLSVACLLAVVVFGYNVYVKNTVNYQHPFFPFKGKTLPLTANSIVDAMDYRHGNKAVNFIKSNFAASTFTQAYHNPLEYKLPFTVSKYELERFAFAGVMIGGFGVWYSGALVISLLMLIYLMYKKRNSIFKNDFILYYFIGIILISILINPLGYIARYIPQYYCIPFLIIIFYQRNKIKPKWSYPLICVLIINSILICGYTYYNTVVTKKVRTQMALIKASNKKYLVDFNQSAAKTALFDAYNIPYEKVEKLNAGVVPDTLFRSEVVYIAQ